MAEQSLKDKTVKGVAWSGIDNIAQYTVSFVVGIVLARLLSPDDYGLLGIIAIFTAVCNTIINGGFISALIRKKEVTEEDYNTVFITNFAVSLILYAVIFFCAPLIARFFMRNELVSLTRVSSLSIVIFSAVLVHQTILTRRVDFKSQTKITLTASGISGIIGIALALLGCGVWALVAQQLINTALRTVLTWLVIKWVPKLSFSIKNFSELFDYGWKIMLNNLFDTLWLELYQVIIARFYSPATLGQYTRAGHFSRFFSRNLTSVVQRVSFPVLSSIQDDTAKMLSAYRRILKISMFITAVGLFSLAAVSEPLLFCLIGPQWHEAATYLPVICVSGSLYPLQAVNLNILQIQGRSDLYLILGIIRKIISVIPLSIGAFIGILPMLYASVIAGVINFFLNSHYTGKKLNYSSWMQLKDVAPSYMVASGVALSVYFFKLLPVSNWLILPLQTVIGTLVFFLICKRLRIAEYQELEEIVRQQIKVIKKSKEQR